MAWIYVPKGACEKIVGAHLSAAIDLRHEGGQTRMSTPVSDQIAFLTANTGDFSALAADPMAANKTGGHNVRGSYVPSATVP